MEHPYREKVLKKLTIAKPKFLKKKKACNLQALCAPDEIRTHIDGTGNHNSIH